MAKLFTNSRKSARLQNWNYAWKALYFVTIKTRLGESYFGEIINGQMILNEIGRTVEIQWLLTPHLRPDMNIELDEFVIMPNHFHGIIGIGRNKFNSGKGMNSFNTGDGGIAQNSFGPQRKNLGSVMRGFKSSVTQCCRIEHTLFDWHPRFHDIIIRDEVILNKIRKYIQNNPLKWHKDRFSK